jgi:hypothetical protein
MERDGNLSIFEDFFLIKLLWHKNKHLDNVFHLFDEQPDLNLKVVAGLQLLIHLKILILVSLLKLK